MTRRKFVQGSFSGEHVVVVVGVALAGVAGLGALGSASRAAIAGDAAGSARALDADALRGDSSSGDRSGAADPAPRSALDFGGAVLSALLAPVVGVEAAEGDRTAGIDVSHWQGHIDWDSVKGSGVAYAIMRVSDGLGTIDDQFERNWAEAERVGVVRGAYQYFRPGQDPIAQAKLFVEKVGPLDENDLPPVLDLEGGGNEHIPPEQVAAAAKQWLDYVYAATGKKPIVYTGYYYFNDGVASPELFGDYPLWIANYSSDDPMIPSPWNHWVLFQHTSEGAVPGIAGNVDMNWFAGDLAALEAFAKGTADCSSGTCVPRVEAPPPPAARPMQVRVVDRRAHDAEFVQRVRRGVVQPLAYVLRDPRAALRRFVLGNDAEVGAPALPPSSLPPVTGQAASALAPPAPVRAEQARPAPAPVVGEASARTASPALTVRPLPILGGGESARVVASDLGSGVPLREVDPAVLAEIQLGTDRAPGRATTP